VQLATFSYHQNSIFRKPPSLHSAKHQQRARILAGLSKCRTDEVLRVVAHRPSVCLSVPCLRFNRNRDAVETSNLMDTYYKTRETGIHSFIHFCKNKPLTDRTGNNIRYDLINVLDN